MDPRDALDYLASNGIPPDGETALRIAVGLDDALREFERETLPFLAAGGAEVRFVEAPYGRGKSHLLRMMETTARRAGFVTAYVDCHSGQRPFESFERTYRAIAARTQVPDLADTDGKPSGLHRVVAAGLRGLLREQPGHEVDSIRRDVFLGRDFRNIVVACALAQSEPSRDELQSQLGALLSASLTDRVSLSDVYRSHRDLPRPLGKLVKRNAGTWLRSLCSLPSALHYPGFVVLFDETEPTLSIAGVGSRWQRQEHFANIRNLVDHVAIGGIRGCAFIYAVVDDFLDTARRELGALAQRIEREDIGLPEDKGRNLRAVWGTLDELTRPNPSTREFFVLLADKLTEWAVGNGGDPTSARRARARVEPETKLFPERLDVGAVREFVKRAASMLASEGVF